MKHKHIILTLVCLFTLSLSACDKNRHPASDTSEKDNAPANALSYENSDRLAQERTNSDVASPGHGPVPDNRAADTKRNSSVDQNTRDRATMPPAANTGAGTPPDTGTTASPSRTTTATNNQNPNDIANPHPSNSATDID